MQVSSKILGGVVAGLAAALPVTASAAIITFSATLNDSQEVPPPPVNLALTGGGTASPTGTGTGRLDTVTNQFSGSLTWNGLTTQATRGHIHIAPPGVNGPILINYFDFVGQPNNFLPSTGSFTLAPITLTDAQESSLLQNLAIGALYFNIHTTQNPAGEIRGNIAAQSIAAVPVPASLALVGIGMVAAGAVARRRRG